MRLSSSNITDYLARLNLCPPQERDEIQIEPVAAKNFNLLVTYPNGEKLLVKQERHNREGKTAGEFQQEWRLQAFLQQFPELDYLRSSVPIVLHFDAEHSIMVFRYLDDYRDLSDFYAKEKIFPTAIASEIGTILATIHRGTMNRQVYRDFFSHEPDSLTPNQVPKLIRGLERISPEIFGRVPADGLKFFSLYQRYDSLGQAIAELGEAFTPCCLTHNDLKLNNILLHADWQQSSDSSPLTPRRKNSEASSGFPLFKGDGRGIKKGGNMVRLIDWERSNWGDPAFDLGTLIASYQQIWLSSLVVSQSLSIEESLRLATIPLEQLQPSIAALTIAYIKTFPEIIEHRPDFLWQVVQFAGLSLIQQIQAMIQYQKSFGNAGICMLQVAKSLLCRPDQSMLTIFGTAISVISEQLSVISEKAEKTTDK